MKPTEREMLAELLEEASQILIDFEIASAEARYHLPNSYRYALKDELYGYSLLIKEEME